MNVVEHDLKTGKKQTRKLTPEEQARLKDQQAVAAAELSARLAAQENLQQKLEAARKSDEGNDLMALVVPPGTSPDMEALLTALLCKVQRLEAEILELRRLDS